MSNNQMSTLIENLFKRSSDYNDKLYNNLKNIMKPKFNKEMNSITERQKLRFTPNISESCQHKDSKVNYNRNIKCRSRSPIPSSPLRNNTSSSKNNSTISNVFENLKTSQFASNTDW